MRIRVFAARSWRVASVLSLSVLVLTLASGSALAVGDFTETFSTSDSGWLNGETAAAPPTYNASGGFGGSGGYIAYTAPSFNSGTGGFGDPLKLMFRGNNANNASGDAFVGNWIADGVDTLSFAVRHNHSTALNAYARIAGVGGAGASLTNTALFSIAPNTWTVITIPITDSNPPFVSYGSSNFAGVFSNVQNLQLGLYLPANTTFASLRMDLDHVNVTVPEPTTAVLLGLGLAGLAIRRRTIER